MLATDRTITRRIPGSYRSRTGRKKSGDTNRHKPRKFDAPFIAWDGEGYDGPDGQHHYNMLVCSTGDYLMAPEGKSLTTRQCFELFHSVSRRFPGHNHVIFAGGYDFNKILNQLSRYDVERVHKVGRCYWDEYRIELRNRKSLSVRNRTSDDWLIVYDVWPFFQTSFLKTLKAWGITVEESVVAGKAARSGFTYADRAEVLSYCRAELRALVVLMDTFRDGLREAGIIVDRWDGPGAVAGALYRTHKTKDHKNPMEGGNERVNRAAQVAYFGGRIETVRFGNHEGPTWYYDINSAYPFAISQLPSLSSGAWRRSRSDNPPSLPLSLYHLEWDFTNSEPHPFYPLPFRRKDGSIAFFPRGKGWYHQPEYDLLREYFPGQYEVTDAYLFAGGEPSGTNAPFSWVTAMYDQRAQWKAQGRGEEKILKLGMNSLYGKMVQQIGWSPERGLPPYHQLEWGGFVTSFTRAMLYRAAMLAPDAVVGFETDGLMVTEELPIESPGLGGWSSESYEGITYAQPGVYWLKSQGAWTGKHRGFDPGSLARNSVLKAWTTGSGEVSATSTRFIGMGLALASNYSQWGNWETSERNLSVWPDSPKRTHPVGDCGGVCRPISGPGSRARTGNPAQGLHQTRLQWDNPGYWTGEESEPYPLQWRDNVNGYSYAAMMADKEDNDLYWEDL